jgi:hypothetical protein
MECVANTTRIDFRIHLETTLAPSSAPNLLQNGGSAFMPSCGLSLRLAKIDTNAAFQ